MLSSRFLASAPDEIVELYADMELELIELLSKKLARLKEYSSIQAFQFNVFSVWNQNAINKIIEKYNHKLDKRLEEIFEKARDKGNEGFTESQRQILKLFQSRPVHSTFEALGLTSQKIKRLTQTIADSSQQSFIKQANLAFAKTSTGAFSYDDAIRGGVKNLATNGIYTVDYSASGRTITRSVESMIRTNVMTGINQMAGKQAIENAGALDTNLVEVSAHMGARPEHAEWQGQVFMLEGSSDKYKNISETGYGEPGGLMGVNCRHYMMPYIEGEERIYNAGELDEMREPMVTYNGQRITQYDAEQKMRYIERQIREQKKIEAGLKAAKYDASEARDRRLFWYKEARDLVSQTGIRRDYTRTYIGK